MQVEVGAIIEGKVTGLTNFGAFVSLPEGKTGMVHISEVAPAYVKEIRDFLTEGQDVKVKVLNIGEDGKISLSIKKAQDPPKNADRGDRGDRGERGDRRTQRNGQRRGGRPANVWQGQKQTSNENMSFEDMMAKFKQVSEEKMSDLKRASESKHGGGFNRRNPSGRP